MKAVAVVSGGMDSVTLAHYLQDAGYDVHMLTVDYGQRHVKELRFARECSNRLNVPHEVVDLKALLPLLQGSSLTDPGIDVPEGHYAAESMKATIVPNRNMMLLAVATAWAVSLKADVVALGAHAGDHAIYPDCRPEFCAAMAEAMALCDERPVELRRPFIDMTKADIVRVADRLGVPLGSTWSCYKGGQFHCGKCGTCVERREAFELAGVKDPTTYEPGEAGLVHDQ